MPRPHPAFRGKKRKEDPSPIDRKKGEGRKLSFFPVRREERRGGRWAASKMSLFPPGRGGREASSYHIFFYLVSSSPDERREIWLSSSLKTDS